MNKQYPVMKRLKTCIFYHYYEKYLVYHLCAWCLLRKWDEFFNIFISIPPALPHNTRGDTRMLKHAKNVLQKRRAAPRLTLTRMRVLAAVQRAYNVSVFAGARCGPCVEGLGGGGGATLLFHGLTHHRRRLAFSNRRAYPSEAHHFPRLAWWSL